MSAQFMLLMETFLFIVVWIWWGMSPNKTSWYLPVCSCTVRELSRHSSAASNQVLQPLRHNWNTIHISISITSRGYVTTMVLTSCLSLTNHTRHNAHATLIPERNLKTHRKMCGQSFYSSISMILSKHNLMVKFWLISRVYKIRVIISCGFLVNFILKHTENMLLKLLQPNSVWFSCDAIPVNCRGRFEKVISCNFYKPKV